MLVKCNDISYMKQSEAASDLALSIEGARLQGLLRQMQEQSAYQDSNDARVDGGFQGDRSSVMSNYTVRSILNKPYLSLFNQSYVSNAT